jgi:hypothetical protein
MNNLTQLRAGRDLDRAIANEVLKMSVPDESAPAYSTDLAAAFGLVEELCRDAVHGRRHFSLFMFTTHWKAMFGTPDLIGGGGKDDVDELLPASTPAMAICLAALQFKSRASR